MFKAFVKYLLILFLVCVVLVFAGVAVVCFSPKAMQTVLTFGINGSVKDVAVRHLVIDEQNIQWPSRIAFMGVSFSLDQGQNRYDLYFENIQVSEIWNLFSSGKGIALQLTGGDVEAENFSLRGVDIFLVSQKTNAWRGLIFLKRMQGQGARLTDVKMQVDLDPSRIIVSELSATAYEGTLNGQATVSLLPEHPFTIDVDFKGLDAQGLESLNVAVFSQFRGLLYGDAKIAGANSAIEKIQASAYLKDGGQVQAKAFEPLLAYLPKSLEKERLQKAIADKTRIDVNDARIALTNQDNEIVSTQIKINSEELNLDVNLTVDIIIEGGLHHLLEYVVPISQFLKGE